LRKLSFCEIHSVLISDALKWYPADGFFSSMERSFLVSGKGQIDAGLVLLISPESASDLWQTWFFNHMTPGDTRYPSFRHYFEQVFQDLAADTCG
jgi:hypothetical protein